MTTHRHAQKKHTRNKQEIHTYIYTYIYAQLVTHTYNHVGEGKENILKTRVQVGL